MTRTRLASVLGVPATSRGGTGGDCKRGTGAFAVQLDASSVLTTNASHVFNFLACSGAEIPRWQTRLPRFKPTLPGTRTTRPSASAEMTSGSSRFSKHACYTFGGSCEDAKATARQRMTTLAADLATVYGSIVDAVSANRGSREFLLNVVGYSRFFDNSTTDCDNYSFGFSSSGKLTQKLRGEMNDLVVELNGKIREAVNLASTAQGYESVRYVDADAGFSTHRFCEPGQTEPQRDDGTWFFLLFGGDSPPNVGGGDDEPDDDPPVDLSPADCAAALAKEDPTFGEDLGRIVYCGIRQGVEQGFAPPDWFANDPVYRVTELLPPLPP